MGWHKVHCWSDTSLECPLTLLLTRDLLAAGSARCGPAERPPLLLLSCALLAIKKQQFAVPVPATAFNVPYAYTVASAYAAEHEFVKTLLEQLLNSCLMLPTDCFCPLAIA